MELLASIQPWHWFVLGVLLLISEVFGAGGFLIGLVVASFIQGFISAYFENLSWDLQLMIFAFDSILFTVLYWKLLRKFNEKTDAPVINNRAAQYIGRAMTLDDEVVNGHGKIKIGDTLWRVKSQHDIAAGKTVNIIGSEGMILVIEEIK